MASCSESSSLVLVAVDGSEFSNRALHLGTSKLNFDDVEKAFRSAWDEADKLMDNYKKISMEYGVNSVKEFLEHGRKPGEAICSVAERENPVLIVLGKRGQSLIRRTLLGSVSDYVVKHSINVPTLVVP